MEAGLLVSFVLTFVWDRLWPFLIGLSIYLIGMIAFVAPSRRNLDRRQEQLQRQGSMLSIREALRSPAPGTGRR